MSCAGTPEGRNSWHNLAESIVREMETSGLGRLKESPGRFTKVFSKDLFEFFYKSVKPLLKTNAFRLMALSQ